MSLATSQNTAPSKMLNEAETRILCSILARDPGWLYINVFSRRTKICTNTFALDIGGGNGPGAPGSLNPGNLTFASSARWSIRCDDSSIASADKSSRVTKSTEKNKLKVEKKSVELLFSKCAHIILYQLTVVVRGIFERRARKLGIGKIG